MISETGSVEAMLRSPGLIPPFSNGMTDHSRLDRLDPMQNQLCRVCDEPAAGFHFGAFTCEGCKSFFGRTCNNQSVIQECKNNYRCVVDKKNRTACKACRLRKCLMVGMSKSGSRYGRRSNWFKIHCLMQQNLHGVSKKSPPGSSSASTSSLSPTSAPPPPPPPQIAPPPPIAATTALPQPPTQPSSLWHSPPKSDSREATPPNLPTTPEPPAATTSISSRLTSSLPPPPLISSLSPSSSASPESPFKVFLPSSSSLSPSKSAPELPTSSALPTPPPPAPPTTLPPAAAAPLASLYAAGFPSPLASLAFPGIPLHKQALLSPLLAHSQLWQMATAATAATAGRHPLLSAAAAAGMAGKPPELPATTAAATASPAAGFDLLAEHKALMERFAAATQVAAAAAAAAAAATNSKEEEREEDEEASSRPGSNGHKENEEPQQTPMDLSSKTNNSTPTEVTSSSPASEDVNRNSLLRLQVKSEEVSLVDLCTKANKKAASPPASL